MRPHMLSLSANTSLLLRQALPALVQLQPYRSKSKSILSRAGAGAGPNPTLLLRTTSCSLIPVPSGGGLPRHDSDRSLFTLRMRTRTRSSLRRLSTRATHVNDAGSIDLPLMQSMEKKIKEQLNAESVAVKDAYGDGRHVSIDVVSTAFEGQSAVNRQRMVYKAIWEELQTTVHAVDQMTTCTPAEASARNDKSS